MDLASYGTVGSYVYNREGMRVQKTVGSTVTDYLSNLLESNEAELMQTDIDQVLKLFYAKNSRVRTHAAWVAGVYYKPHFEQPLVRLLRDWNLLVSVYACDSLSNSDNMAVSEKLLPLMRHPRRMMRGYALQSYTYGIGGGLLSIYYGGAHYYYLRNGQSDIIGLMDGSGATVVNYSYNAWGKVLSVTGTLASTLGADNPFRYRGYYYDTETELYYLQSRYYDPETCRFLNGDVLMSTGQGVVGYNTYVYCLNDPVNMTDVDGELAVELLRLFLDAHKAVQDDIIAKSGGTLVKEVTIDYLSGGFGRAAIFNPATGEVWEVKHAGVSGKRAARQLDRYVSGTARFYSEQTVRRGVQSFSGTVIATYTRFNIKRMRKALFATRLRRRKRPGKRLKQRVL